MILAAHWLEFVPRLFHPAYLRSYSKLSNKVSKPFSLDRASRNPTVSVIDQRLLTRVHRFSTGCQNDTSSCIFFDEKNISINIKKMHVRLGGVFCEDGFLCQIIRQIRFFSFFCDGS
jgi:hypothetical protein